MFPVVQEPTQCYFQPNFTSKHSVRKKWQSEAFVLINVEPPKRLVSPQGKTSPKRYASIRFKFYDKQRHQYHTKTIFFGQPDGQYVGDKNLQKRAHRHTNLSHKADPFHPNYWRLQILNNKQTMQQSYLAFSQSLLKLNTQYRTQLARVRKPFPNPQTTGVVKK